MSVFYRIVNAEARAGRAEAALRGMPPAEPAREEFVVRRPSQWSELPEWIESRLRAGPSPARFVAAGGDGTAHSVLNLLIEAETGLGLPEHAWELGFVALGSSNDYHKRRDHRVTDPRRTDFARASPHDLLRAEISGEEGSLTRYSALNFSAGITAAGNEIFNSSGLVRGLKRLSVDAAIGAAALSAFVARSPHPAEIRVDDAPPRRIELLNAGVFKNRHFSGSFRYPLDVAPDSGDFGYAFVPRLPLARLLAVFSGLARGEFDVRSGIDLGRARSLSIRFARPAPIEIDGEVFRARAVDLSIHSRKAWLCP